MTFFHRCQQTLQSQRQHLHKKNPNYCKTIASQHSPHTLFIACCDARNDPASLFQLDQGEAFVLRSIAAWVPEYRIADTKRPCPLHAGIAYAVTSLKISRIVLLGHSNCAGVIAAHSPSPLELDPSVSAWVHAFSPNTPAKNPAAPEHVHTILHTSIRNTLSYPCVYEGLQKQKLTLHAWFHSLTDASLFSIANITKV